MKHLIISGLILFTSTMSFARGTQLQDGEVMVMDRCYSESISDEGVMIFFGTYFPSEKTLEEAVAENPFYTCEYYNMSSDPIGE